jgi:CheY-like chemotaxis protein
VSASQWHQEIILVADDKEANRELLSALLSAEGWDASLIDQLEQLVAESPQLANVGAKNER